MNEGISDIDPCISRRTAGLTLIETLVALSIFGTLLGAATSASTAILDGSNESYTIAMANESARRVVDRLVRELRGARLSSVVINAGSTITFDVIEGWDGSSPRIGPTKTISFSGGDVLVNGTKIASRLDDLQFSLNDRTLTVIVFVARDITVKGDPRPIYRGASAQMAL